MEPKRFTVPPRTASPTETSTGMDSPVMAEASTEDDPDMTVPSTGTCSPGRILTTVPFRTSDKSTSLTEAPSTILAVLGLLRRSSSIPDSAWPQVASSRMPPMRMIIETSAAAAYSPMQMAAAMPTDTRRSAVTSWSRTSASAAPRMIGRPHRTMATE